VIEQGPICAVSYGVNVSYFRDSEQRMETKPPGRLLTLQEQLDPFDSNLFKGRGLYSMSQALCHTVEGKFFLKAV